MKILCNIYINYYYKNNFRPQLKCAGESDILRDRSISCREMYYTHEIFRNFQILYFYHFSKHILLFICYHPGTGMCGATLAVRLKSCWAVAPAQILKKPSQRRAEQVNNKRRIPALWRSIISIYRHSCLIYL